MSGIASHLLRRGLEASQQRYNNADLEPVSIPTWGLITLIGTVVLWFVAMSAV